MYSIAIEKVALILFAVGLDKETKTGVKVAISNPYVPQL